MPPVRLPQIKPDPDNTLPYSLPSDRKTCWSAAELEMLRAGREINKPWQTIANEINAAFGQTRSINAYQKYFSKWGRTSAEWSDEKIEKLRQVITSGGVLKRQYMEGLRALGGEELSDMSVQQIEKKYKEIMRSM